MWVKYPIAIVNHAPYPHPGDAMFHGNLIYVQLDGCFVPGLRF
jgi:hypothetical protein